MTGADGDDDAGERREPPATDAPDGTEESGTDPSREESEDTESPDEATEETTDDEATGDGASGREEESTADPGEEAPERDEQERYSPDPTADLPPEVVDETRELSSGETAEFDPSVYGYGSDDEDADEEPSGGEDADEEPSWADQVPEEGMGYDRPDGSDADDSGQADDTDDIIDIGGLAEDDGDDSAEEDAEEATHDVIDVGSEAAPDSGHFEDDDWDPDDLSAGETAIEESATVDDAASDGGTVADSTFAGGDDGIFSSGPEYDEEMPLAEHIEEMVRRLGVVVVVMAVVSIGVLPFSDAIINYVWYTILGTAQDVPTKPNVYKPLSLLLARLKTATLAGFVVALPLFVYETYLFMRPGLYPNERRYYLAAVPTSLVLAAIGVAFAFFLVLPAIFIYFLYYSERAAAIAFGLSDTYGLMLMLMGFFAVIFQIPLFIMLAIMMNLTSREWLAERRILFWGAFLGIALLFSPDPTGMAPIIVALTMVVLFEGTLLLLRWTDRGSRRDEGGGGPEVEP